MLSLPIHHIGIASVDISKELLVFYQLGFMKEDEFIDKAQGVKGVFVIPNDKSLPQYRFELLENLHEQGPLTNYLKNKTKMYHIAYKSEDIQKDMQSLLSAGGGMLITPIMSASYFKRICFVMLKNRLLVELVEEK